MAAARTKTAKPVTIVIAWTVTEMTHDGKPFRRDLGERPTLVSRPVGRACTWLLRGTRVDVAKAQAYVTAENAKARGPDQGPIVVFTFPTSTTDPLALARRRITGE